MNFKDLGNYIAFIQGVLSRHVRNKILFTCLIVFLTTSFASLTPIFLQELINNLLYNIGKEGMTFLCLTLYLASVFFSRAANDIRWKFYGVAEQEIKFIISERFFKHIFRMPHSFFLERNQSEISQIMTTASESNRNIMINILFALLPTCVELASAGIVLFYFGDHVILCAISLYIIIYLSTSTNFIMSLTAVNRAANKETRRSLSLLGDAMINVESIKYFNAFDNIHLRYSESIYKVKDLWSCFYRKKIHIGLIQGISFTITLGGCLIYAIKQVQNGTMLIGHFVLISAYILQVCRPLEGAVMSLRDVRQGIASMEPYFEIINNTVSIHKTTSSASESYSSMDQIRFENVSFSYGDRCVLDSVSFNIYQGDITAIIGPTGAGKSTIVKLLLALYFPDNGNINMFGQAITTGNEDNIRQSISVVPQDIVLFNDTIGFNIGLGKHNYSMQDIQNAARLARINNFIESLPDGYDTLVGNQGLKLSGGERQRIAIARALISDPKVIILDEATSSLDIITENEIITELLSVTAGKTLIIISHRYTSIKLADHIIVLEKGKVSEHGSPAVLAKNNGWYSNMIANHRNKDDVAMRQSLLSEVFD